jgi:nucleotide-binding universal stress UspA family protein
MKENRMPGKDRPILIAYDGSEYAKAAIKQAGEQLRDGRRAIVLTVWQPFSVTGFVGAPGVAPVGLEEDVERDARRVAEEGAQLARQAGFDAESVAERGDPTWERIVQSADEHDAGIVVMGSHGRTGISRVLLGSVADATASHIARPVLIAHNGVQPGPESSP